MITHGRVREAYEYHKNGTLVWKIDLPKRKRRGKVAGYQNGLGYTILYVDGTLYLAHRIIWMWHKGYLPEHGIDHINRNRSDNRIENLREVSQSCNSRNTGNNTNNTSGVKGVQWHKPTRMWCARIKTLYKDKHLGYYHEFDEAVLARLAAEQCLDWSGCDSSSPAYQFTMKNILS